MRIAKSFHWEAAHRLSFHDGDCRNLHGHSYRMSVELEGAPGENGMVMDFKDLKLAVKPLVKQWDHATLVAESDAALIKALDTLGTKVFVLPYESTSENLCTYAAEYIVREAAQTLGRHHVTRIRVRIFETDSSYAEQIVHVPGLPNVADGHRLQTQAAQ